MAFPCRNYEDFSSGQCTNQLMEHHYDSVCFDQQPAIVTNLTTCPIRLGLNSELDYKRQLERLNNDNDHRDAGLVYFLQTADKAPFCKYHYELKVILRVSPHRYVRKFRKFAIGDNSALLNGRLYVTVVGSRSRTVVEMAFKQNDNTAEMADSNERTGTEAIQLKEHQILISEPDFGDMLRLELEWRPYNNPIQRPLKQTRALRRWLPQLATLETSIPNVLNELQRTLNVNASHLQAHTSHLLGWPSQQLNDIIHPKNAAEPVSFAPPEPISAKVKEIPPFLEALVITKLETGEKDVFCASEPEMKMIFQPKHFVRNGILINPNQVKPEKDTFESHALNTETLISQLCIRDIL